MKYKVKSMAGFIQIVDHYYATQIYDSFGIVTGKQIGRAHV